MSWVMVNLALSYRIDRRLSPDISSYSLENTENFLRIPSATVVVTKAAR